MISILIYLSLMCYRRFKNCWKDAITMCWNYEPIVDQLTQPKHFSSFRLLNMGRSIKKPTAKYRYSQCTEVNIISEQSTY